jgi:hypothetical protein
MLSLASLDAIVLKSELNRVQSLSFILALPIAIYLL